MTSHERTIEGSPSLQVVSGGDGGGHVLLQACPTAPGSLNTTTHCIWASGNNKCTEGSRVSRTACLPRYTEGHRLMCRWEAWPSRPIALACPGQPSVQCSGSRQPISPISNLTFFNILPYTVDMQKCSGGKISKCLKVKGLFHHNSLLKGLRWTGSARIPLRVYLLTQISWYIHQDLCISLLSYFQGECLKGQKRVFLC